jgi:hypothetical protein
MPDIDKLPGNQESYESKPADCQTRIGIDRASL